jgi:hypothetical protein
VLKPPSPAFEFADNLESRCGTGSEAMNVEVQTAVVGTTPERDVEPAEVVIQRTDTDDPEVSKVESG